MTDDQLDRYWNADHMTRSRDQALGWGILTCPTEILLLGYLGSIVRRLDAAMGS